MTSIRLSEKAGTYLQRLCLEIPHRRVGSSGNRTATEVFAKIVASFGFQTECPEFDCIDWTQSGAHLTVDGELFEAFVSPYSPGVHVRAPLRVASKIDDLPVIDVSNTIVLLRGDIAKEQ